MKVKNVSPLDGFFVNQQKPFIRYAFNSIEKKNATLFLIFGSSKRNQTTNDSIKIFFFSFYFGSKYISLFCIVGFFCLLFRFISVFHSLCVSKNFFWCHSNTIQNIANINKTGRRQKSLYNRSQRALYQLYSKKYINVSSKREERKKTEEQYICLMRITARLINYIANIKRNNVNWIFENNSFGIPCRKSF